MNVGMAIWVGTMDDMGEMGDKRVGAGAANMDGHNGYGFGWEDMIHIGTDGG